MVTAAPPGRVGGFVRRVDDVLRGRPWVTSSQASTSQLLLCIVIFGMFYGACMGTYGGVGGDRAIQPLYAAVKVPLLLTASFLLAIPSFYVLNLLMGVGSDFGQVLRALFAAQAGLTIVLASLAPFTMLWYASFSDHDNAILFNAAMFTIASAAAQRMLRVHYRALIASNPRHRQLRRVWLAIYAFVGIQFGWLLRPFIGAPNLPVTFFRSDSWGNAYVQVVHLIMSAMSGRGG